jgi:hypothetical protein
MDTYKVTVCGGCGSIWENSISAHCAACESVVLYNHVGMGREEAMVKALIDSESRMINFQKAYNDLTTRLKLCRSRKRVVDVKKTSDDEG